MSRTPQDSPVGWVSPWENGSALYRRLVLTGSALFLIGIVLSVVGALAQRQQVSFAALGVLGLGVVVHLSAQTVRLRQAARRGQTPDGRPDASRGAGRSTGRGVGRPRR